MKTLTLTRTWRGSHKGLHLKLAHTEGQQNDGFGSWCYYIVIAEHSCPDFESLWLPGEVLKITPESYGWVRYHYEDTAAASVDWHGGVTFYAKHEELPGFRSVEFGCDYSHLWDSERGFENIKLGDVFEDAIRTAEQLAKLLNIKQQ